MRERPTDGFQYHIEDLRRRGIDLVLVLDATGSMAPVIQAAKRRIAAVAAELRRIVPDLRVRIVAYRDRGDVFLTLASPLTHEIRVLEDFLACIPAAGGGDGPAGGEAALAREWGVGEGAVRVALHRFRQRFASLLRQEIERTVARSEDVDDELRALMAALH